jgi:hypothetical protein
MSVPGALLGLGQRALDALLQIRERDPKKKAAVSLARSQVLTAEADHVETEAKGHELNSLSGDNQSRRFHLRRARRLFRKRDRLRTRSHWWALRAARWSAAS